MPPADLTVISPALVAPEAVVLILLTPLAEKPPAPVTAMTLPPDVVMPEARMIPLPRFVPALAIVGVTEKPAPAYKPTFKASVPLLEIAATTVMSLLASKLSVPAPAAVTALLTVMLPWIVLPPPLVCTVTVLPPVMALPKEVALTVALAALLPANSVVGLATLRLALAALLMVTLVGSSSHWPPLPAAPPLTLTLPCKPSMALPEVSTLPPWLFCPVPVPAPVALMLPSISVRPSAQTTTVPPLPCALALASIVAPLCTMVRLALRVTPSACAAPCQPPPTSTVPPPAWPDASSLAPLRRPTLSPSTAICPPLSPVFMPLAASSPETSVVPVLPLSSVIRPGLTWTGSV